MSKWLEVQDFEHGKVYHVLWYHNNKWYPKSVKIHKDKNISFEDINKPNRFYWFYDLYILLMGKDIKGQNVWQVLTYDTFEEAEIAAKIENRILIS